MTTPPDPTQPRGGWRPAPQFGAGARRPPQQAAPGPQPALGAQPVFGAQPVPGPAVAPGPVPGPADDDPVDKRPKEPGSTRLAATVMLAVIGYLAFAGSWLVAKSDGHTVMAFTLSRGIRGFPSEASDLGGSGWAIALVVLLGFIALGVWSGDGAEASAAAASKGAVVLIVAILFTWLGRSVWFHPDDSALREALHMGWAYYVSLALAVGLLFVPWFFAFDDQD